MWWKEERRWLDDHKLKRLVQYYFPATLESPTRSQIIWLSNVKVVYGVEMTVNLCGQGKVEVPSDIQTKRNVSYWEWIKEDLFFSGFNGLSVNKTNSKLKTQKLTCFCTTSGLQPFFPISALPDGNRRQKLNTKRRRINRAISGGAIVKMGFLSNKSVDKWREWVKGKKGFGEGTVDSVLCWLALPTVLSPLTHWHGSDSHLYSSIKSNHMPLVPAHLMRMRLLR